MDEKDAIKRLGAPSEVVGREQRMRSPKWICWACREIVASTVPIPVPAPCPRCGGIEFEAVRPEPQ